MAEVVKVRKCRSCGMNIKLGLDDPDGDWSWQSQFDRFSSQHLEECPLSNGWFTIWGPKIRRR